LDHWTDVWLQARRSDGQVQVRVQHVERRIRRQSVRAPQARERPADDGLQRRRGHERAQAERRVRDAQQLGGDTAAELEVVADDDVRALPFADAQYVGHHRVGGRVGKDVGEVPGALLGKGHASTLLKRGLGFRQQPVKRGGKNSEPLGGHGGAERRSGGEHHVIAAPTQDVSQWVQRIRMTRSRIGNEQHLLGRLQKLVLTVDNRELLRRGYPQT
jgi:hypothetical protein